jgi:AAA domain, putative AbiEii toxin, Type IV TA system
LVTLENLDRLNVLIGKNSSGKSNILEGLELFFSAFALAGGATSGLNDYFWHGRQTKDPISFILTFELSEDDLLFLFPEELLAPARDALKDRVHELTIRREIVNVQGTWRTGSVEWGGIALVRDDKPLTPEEFANSWNTTQKQREITPVVLPAVPPQTLSTVQTKLLERVKAQFKFVPAIRDVKNPVQQRMTLLDANVQSRLWTLEQSVSPPDERKYSEIETAFRNLTDLNLAPAQGQLLVRRGTTRFPLQSEGGGIQASANLAFDLLSESDRYRIIAIEEPESHSHPDLQRRLFGLLDKLATNHQILVSTHSTTFVNRTDPRAVWVVKLVDNETQVSRVGELREVLEETGAKPSDVFLDADRLLFVEGESDKIALTAFAKKAGISLAGAKIVPLGGKTKAETAVRVWLSIAKGAMPLFVVMDSDAKEIAIKLTQEGLIERKAVHVWAKGAVENYYPQDTLRAALEELSQRYQLEMDVGKVVEGIQKGVSPAKIDLGEKRERLDRSFQVLLAEAFERQLESASESVPEEVRRVLERAISL